MADLAGTTSTTEGLTVHHFDDLDWTDDNEWDDDDSEALSYGVLPAFAVNASDIELALQQAGLAQNYLDETSQTAYYDGGR